MDKLRRFFTFEEEYDDYSADGSQDSSVASVQLTEVHRAAVQKGNLVAIPSVKPKTQAKQEIVICEPNAVGQATDIAEALKQNKCVLLNLMKTDKELCRRTVDFLSGISYATGGSFKKIVEQIYLFVPASMTITAASRDRSVDIANPEPPPTPAQPEYKSSYPGGYR